MISDVHGGVRSAPERLDRLQDARGFVRGAGDNRAEMISDAVMPEHRVDTGASSGGHDAEAVTRAVELFECGSGVREQDRLSGRVLVGYSRYTRRNSPNSGPQMPAPTMWPNCVRRG